MEISANMNQGNVFGRRFQRLGLSRVGLSDLGRPRGELEQANINTNETNDRDTGEPRVANNDTQMWPTPNEQKYTATNVLVFNDLPARPAQRNTLPDILRRVRGLDLPSESGGGGGV